MSVHNPFYHTAAGVLAMLLPAAELEVMRVIWTHGPLEARAVYKYVAAQRAVAPTTVRTTLDRLADKGLLHRPRQYGSVYTATVGEREFVLQAVTRMLDCVVREYPSVITEYLDIRREHAVS
jgi:predicted transcriptional regulator